MKIKVTNTVLIIILILLITNRLKAQAPDCVYAKGFGGSLEDYCYGVEVDEVGNSYITGAFFGPYNFNDTVLQSTGYYDGYFAKLDANGNFQWAKSFGNSGYEGGWNIKVDRLNNIYIIGVFEDSLVFGNTVLISNISRNIFVAKFDSIGNSVWAKSIDNTGGSWYELGLCLDLYNNVYITGCFSYNTTIGNVTLTSTSLGDVFTAKLDSNGNCIWATSFSSTLISKGCNISVNNQNNVYVSGFFRDTLIVGSDSLIGSNMVNVFISKLDANGNHLWSRSFGSLGVQNYSDLTIDGLGNSYLIGLFDGTINLGGNNFTSNGSVDTFILKLDLNGNLVWVKSFGGTGYDGGEDLVSDALGNTYITGMFDNTVNFGNTTLTSLGNDIFVSKIDFNGNFVWAKSCGSIGMDGAWGIAIDTLGNSYTVGCFNGSMALDNFTLTAVSNNWDAFVFKLGNTPSGLDQNELEHFGVTFYPNPVTHKEINADFTVKGNIRLFNIQGQLVYQQNDLVGKQKINLDLRAGVYIVRLENDLRVSSQKLIIE